MVTPSAQSEADTDFSSALGDEIGAEHPVKARGSKHECDYCKRQNEERVELGIEGRFRDGFADGSYALYGRSGSRPPIIF